MPSIGDNWLFFSSNSRISSEQSVASLPNIVLLPLCRPAVFGAPPRLIAGVLGGTRGLDLSGAYWARCALCVDMGVFLWSAGTGVPLTPATVGRCGRAGPGVRTMMLGAGMARVASGGRAAMRAGAGVSFAATVMSTFVDCAKETTDNNQSSPRVKREGAAGSWCGLGTSWQVTHRHIFFWSFRRRAVCIRGAYERGRVNEGTILHAGPSNGLGLRVEVFGECILEKFNSRLQFFDGVVALNKQG